MSGLKESADGPYTWIILNDFLRIVQAVELPILRDSLAYVGASVKRNDPWERTLATLANVIVAMATEDLVMFLSDQAVEAVVRAIPDITGPEPWPYATLQQYEQDAMAADAADGDDADDAPTQYPPSEPIIIDCDLDDSPRRLDTTEQIEDIQSPDGQYGGRIVHEIESLSPSPVREDSYDYNDMELADQASHNAAVAKQELSQQQQQQQQHQHQLQQPAVARRRSGATVNGDETILAYIQAVGLVPFLESLSAATLQLIGYRYGLHFPTNVPIDSIRPGSREFVSLRNQLLDELTIRGLERFLIELTLPLLRAWCRCVHIRQGGAKAVLVDDLVEFLCCLEPQVMKKSISAQSDLRPRSTSTWRRLGFDNAGISESIPERSPKLPPQPTLQPVVQPPQPQEPPPTTVPRLHSRPQIAAPAPAPAPASAPAPAAPAPAPAVPTQPRKVSMPQVQQTTTTITTTTVVPQTVEARSTSPERGPSPPARTSRVVRAVFQPTETKSEDDNRVAQGQPIFVPAAVPRLRADLPDIKKGATFTELNDNYNLGDLVEWMRARGIRRTGKKRDVIQNILRFLDTGDLGMRAPKRKRGGKRRKTIRNHPSSIKDRALDDTSEPSDSGDGDDNEDDDADDDNADTNADANENGELESEAGAHSAKRRRVVEPPSSDSTPAVEEPPTAPSSSPAPAASEPPAVNTPVARSPRGVGKAASQSAAVLSNGNGQETTLDASDTAASVSSDEEGTSTANQPAAAVALKKRRPSTRKAATPASSRKARTSTRTKATASTTSPVETSPSVAASAAIESTQVPTLPPQPQLQPQPQPPLPPSAIPKTLPISSVPPPPAYLAAMAITHPPGTPYHGVRPLDYYNQHLHAHAHHQHPVPPGAPPSTTSTWEDYSHQYGQQRLSYMPPTVPHEYAPPHAQGPYTTPPQGYAYPQPPQQPAYPYTFSANYPPSTPSLPPVFRR